MPVAQALLPVYLVPLCHTGKSACVTQARVPVSHRQECLCHTGKSACATGLPFGGFFHRVEARKQRVKFRLLEDVANYVVEVG